MTRDKGLMVRNDELTTRNKWGTMGDDEGWWAMLACMMVGIGVWPDALDSELGSPVPYHIQGMMVGHPLLLSRVWWVTPLLWWVSNPHPPSAHEVPEIVGTGWPTVLKAVRQKKLKKHFTIHFSILSFLLVFGGCGGALGHNLPLYDPILGFCPFFLGSDLGFLVVVA
jgi:hypothetical protein